VVAIVIVGYVVGRDALHRERPVRFWLLCSAVSLLVFASRAVVGRLWQCLSLVEHRQP
jgi:hypothetical protein